MRKRKDFKRLEGVKSDRLIVIAAEGRCTENIYFEAMKVSLCASNVHVKVLHRDTNESSPAHVKEQIQKYISDYGIQDIDDELWIVIDRDQWKEKMLSDVAQYCSQNDNLRLALSNPCFELWLLLHFEDVASYEDEMKKKLFQNKKNSKSGEPWLKRRMRELMGSYSESDYDAPSLLPRIGTAINRAEQLDLNKADRWPQTIGTRVYLLAKSIMEDK